ncbi:MAG TPA: peptidoglycan editing factor PgeF, partial [Gammaproteobacteria bacterium]|nr:peptidoglycan editing factor PgeF [Gammaproteobacteria bacterium]
EADASVADAPGRVCAVLTADCLPVLFCDRAGTRVAAAHAGWRGLASGVLEATVVQMEVPPDEIIAWLGPAIGPQAFEVGEEVRAAFVDADAGSAAAFVAHGEDRWLADIDQLARRRLARAGVTAVYGGGRCTYSEAGMFYSYRRDGVTGRMASLVWLTE